MSQNFYRLILISVMAFLLGGCATAKLTYQYHAQPDDPTIEFKSDYKLHTYFSVDTKNAGKNQCVDYDLAGFLLFENSIFLYDKPSTESRIKVPANKPAAFRVMHYVSDPGMTSSCGPLFVVFTPEANKDYIVKMNKSGKQCFVTVNDKADEDLEIKTTSLGNCKK